MHKRRHTVEELNVRHGTILSVFHNLTVQSADADKKQFFKKGDQDIL